MFVLRILKLGLRTRRIYNVLISSRKQRSRVRTPWTVYGNRHSWKNGNNRSFDEKADGKGVAFGVDDRDGVLSLGSDDVHLVDIFGGAEVFGIQMPEHFGLGIAVRKVERRSLDAAVKLPGYGDGAAVFRIYESHRNGGIPVCGLSRSVWRKSLVFGMVLPVIPLHRRR